MVPSTPEYMFILVLRLLIGLGTGVPGFDLQQHLFTSFSAVLNMTKS